MSKTVQKSHTIWTMRHAYQTTWHLSRGNCANNNNKKDGPQMCLPLHFMPQLICSLKPRQNHFQAMCRISKRSSSVFPCIPHQPSSWCFSLNPLHINSNKGNHDMSHTICLPSVHRNLVPSLIVWIQLSPPLLAPQINNHPQTAAVAFLPHLFPTRLLVLISLLFQQPQLPQQPCCLFPICC